MLIVDNTIEAPPGMYRLPGRTVGSLARRILFVKLVLTQRE
jgi:hypothetical protein